MGQREKRRVSSATVEGTLSRPYPYLARNSFTAGSEILASRSLGRYT